MLRNDHLSDATRDEIAMVLITLDATLAAILNDAGGYSPAMDALRGAEDALIVLTGTQREFAAFFGVSPDAVRERAERALDLYRREDWLAREMPMPAAGPEDAERWKLIEDWHWGPIAREQDNA